MGKPDFKPASNQVVILNSEDGFWTALSSTHTSLKKGKASFWIVLVSDNRSDNFKSSNNRRFVKNLGNNFRLPQFQNRMKGYNYEPIVWSWQCRNCRKEIPKEALDSDEICPRCSFKKTSKAMIKL